MKSFYPISLNANYIDDVGYRRFIRELFSMKHTCPWDSDTVQEIDIVSIDEFDYDDDAASKVLDLIYAETHFIPVFSKIYTLAAATMISEDTSIGLVIMFSYNFAHIFHKCLVSFITLNDTTDPVFNDLIQLLSK
jgi:hypothetical protein